ncbi:MAG: hypothetical protein IID36_05745 [Planctomycetes bacterium]|nr:hypothetical protein [Planctomycetota bacterium]
MGDIEPAGGRLARVAGRIVVERPRGIYREVVPPDRGVREVDVEVPPGLTVPRGRVVPERVTPPGRAWFGVLGAVDGPRRTAEREPWVADRDPRVPPREADDEWRLGADDECADRRLAPRLVRRTEERRPDDLRAPPDRPRDALLPDRWLRTADLDLLPDLDADDLPRDADRAPEPRDAECRPEEDDPRRAGGFANASPTAMEKATTATVSSLRVREAFIMAPFVGLILPDRVHSSIGQLFHYVK